MRKTCKYSQTANMNRIIRQVSACSADQALINKKALLNKKIEQDANEITKIKNEIDDFSNKILGDLEESRKESNNYSQLPSNERSLV